MIILVFLGTINQGEYGLYLAQKLYFSSLIYWLWFIPLPGGRLIMFIMFINLFFMLFRKSLWKSVKTGILIVHFGALLLLIGGGLTAFFSSEGRMTIKEGEQSDYIQDYYLKELAILVDDSLIIINQDDLKERNEKSLISFGNINFEIEILSYFTNSKTNIRMDSLNIHRGYYKLNKIEEIQSEKEFEMNNSAIIYKIQGINDEADGIYANTLFGSNLNTINTNKQKIQLSFRPQRTYIPFSIGLVDFKEELHPGTDIARSYSSEVMLNIDGIGRRVMIEMNQPLRYNEYTFFQSSFNRVQNAEFSTFAVVKNYGKLFPYISSIMMCIGLLTHLIIMLLLRPRPKTHK